MRDQEKSLSKFLSLILRHKPETIDLFLDENGWAAVDELIKQANLHNVALTHNSLDSIVETNDKKRFVFSDDKKRIRANQGHSISVDLQLAEAEPPDLLYHGTALRNIDSIKAQGLLKAKRHHVHLSTDRKAAKNVGSRYGKPVVIGVNAKEMYLSGFTFFRAENGVWLTDHVPSQYLDFEPAN
jgi:putative RNA 2'-phosphotransferase